MQSINTVIVVITISNGGSIHSNQNNDAEWNFQSSGSSSSLF